MGEILKSESGFTLLEVVVAIVIITMLTAAFAPIIVSSVQRIKWAGNRMQELYAIQSKMERSIALENDARKQESFKITGSNYEREISGIIIEVDDFVSFISPRETRGE